MPDEEVFRELLVALSIDSGNSAKDLQGISNVVKQADAKFRAAAAGVKDFENTTAGMQAKVAMLTEKLSAQNAAVGKHQTALGKSRDKVQKAADKQKDLAAKIDAARSAYTAQAAATGRDSAESKALGEELAKLEGQFAANGKSAQRAAQDVQKNETALLNAQTAVKLTAKELEGANKDLATHGSKWGQLAKQVNEAGGVLQSAGKKLSTLGGNLTKHVTVPVLAAGGASWLAYNQVDDAVDSITKKTGAVGPVLAGYEKAFNAVFKDMPFSAEVAGTAVGDVVARFKAGGEELENLSELYLMFADLNGADLPASIEKSQRVLAQWGLGAKHVAGFLGLVTKAHQQTGVEVDKLMGSLQANGAVLKAMGLNLSQSVQLLASFEAAGVNVESVLTAIKKAAGEYAKQGVTLEAGLTSTIAAIKGAKTETEALAIAQKVFGAKGGAAMEMATAIREGRLSVTGLTADMATMGNVVADTFNAISGAPERLARLKNQAVSLGAQFGKVMVPWLEKAMEKVSGLLAGFEAMPEAQQKTIMGLAGTAAAVGPILTGLGKLSSGIGSITKLMSGPAGWVTLAVTGVAALGVAIASIETNAEKMDRTLKGIQITVDPASKQAITDTINDGIEAAQSMHVIQVSVEADTTSILSKLNTIFADGKFTRAEYRQALNYVEKVVNPDIEAATAAVNERTKALKQALDGAVNAQGQPLSEAEKTKLIDAVSQKTQTLITDLQTAQTDYEALIAQVYKEGHTPTEAELANLEALLQKIGVLRAELKAAQDEGIQIARANYNMTVSGQGTPETVGSSIGYVQEKRNLTVQDAADIRDKALAAADALGATKEGADAATAAWNAYYTAVANADTEAQAGYQAILDGVAKMAGAETTLISITQDYDTLRKTMEALSSISFTKLLPNGTWEVKDWITPFKDLFGEKGLGKYLSEEDKIKISDLISAENPDINEYSSLKGIAERYIIQLSNAIVLNSADPKLNLLNVAIGHMLDSGALQSIDPTKVDGALESMFKVYDAKARGTQLGNDIAAGVPVGIGEAAESLPTESFDALKKAVLDNIAKAFDIHSPAGATRPSGKAIAGGVAAGVADGTPDVVNSIKAMYGAAISEVRRQESLLQNSMYWLQRLQGGGYFGGGGSPRGSAMPSSNITKHYSASAPMQIENFNVYSQADADVLFAQQSARVRRIQSGYGFMGRG